jgi:hypothetical protein
MTAPAAGLPELVAVHARGPARRGAVSLLILRWDAAGAIGDPSLGGTDAGRAWPGPLALASS